jgi:hypothetical protein
LRTSAHRPGVAEAAVEGAADLARHAQGAAVGVGDEDHFEIVAVMGAQQPLARAVGGDLRFDHLRPRNGEALREPRPLRLGDVGHRVEVGRPAIVDPVPDLLGAQLGLLWLEARLLQGGAKLVLRKPDELRPAVASRKGLDPILAITVAPPRAGRLSRT